MDSILSNIDKIRQSISNATDEKHKARLGQYFTPNRIAMFMAGLFQLNTNSAYKILDPGAGIGSLSIALLERILLNSETKTTSLTAIEYDPILIGLCCINLPLKAYSAI
ncbi:N-6 DNA methylase [Acinetobacter gerneri]|uniref:N-6 DNA methylase n=1 Tax=Acinetobacter gerneri TaxID=202952 RepID=UPI003A891A39